MRAASGGTGRGREEGGREGDYASTLAGLLFALAGFALFALFVDAGAAAFDLAGEGAFFVLVGAAFLLLTEAGAAGLDFAEVGAFLEEGAALGLVAGLAPRTDCEF